MRYDYSNIRVTLGGVPIQQPLSSKPITSVRWCKGKLVDIKSEEKKMELYRFDKVQAFKTVIEDFDILLKGLEVEYVIAGGFARDLYFRQSPKDIDYFLFDTTKNVLAIKSILGDELDVDFKVYTNDDEEFKEYEGTLSAGVTKVIKTQIKEPNGLPVNIDFIFKEPCEEDLLYCVINNFDCNLNKFSYNIKLGKPLILSDILGTNELTFTDFYSLRPSRVERMFEKADSLLFNVDKQLIDQYDKLIRRSKNKDFY